MRRSWFRHLLLVVVLTGGMGVGFSGFHAPQALSGHSHVVLADGDPGVPPVPS